MTSDNYWMLLRSALLIVGGIMVGKGWITQDQVEPLVGALILLGMVGWQIKTKIGTKSVPVEVVEAAKVDPTVPTIPTVSPVTGKVE